MTSIPTLPEHDMHVFVGKHNLLKGQQAVRNGAIISPAPASSRLVVLTTAS